MDQQYQKSTNKHKLFSDMFGNFSSLLFILSTLEENDFYICDYEKINKEMESLLRQLVIKMQDESEERDEKLC